MHSSVEDVYPLTPAQQGILFHCLLRPHSGVYVDQVCCRLGTGEAFDPALFRDTFDRVAERHPVLRSAMLREPADRPHQVVLRHVQVPFHTEDWSGIAGEAQEARLAEFLRQDRERGFDLGQAPLIRWALFRLDARSHRLVLTYQHIILDAWSVFLVIRDILDTYAALREGAVSEAAAPPRPFREYVRWLKGRDSAASELHWRRRLAGFTRPTPLPGAGPAVVPGGGAVGRVACRLDGAPASGLNAFARSRHLTLNSLVLGAWAVLLGRYGGEEDLVFGVALSGRPPSLPGVESMVGLFINTLPLRLETSPAEAVLGWLARVQERQLELLEHEQSQLIQVQGWSEVPRGAPLFESLVVFENVPMETTLRHRLRAQAGLAIEEVDYRPQTNYPLTLLAGGGDSVTLELLYDTARLDAVTVARLGRHLAGLLAALPGAAERCLGDLPLLSEAERQQIVVEWNDTVTPPAVTRTIHGLVEDQAARTPEALALCDLGGREITYRELVERSRRLAGFLGRRGIGPEALVACCLERIAELPALLLGVLGAGAGYVPLDAEYPRERLAQVLDDAGAALLLIHEALRDRLPERRPAEVVLEREQSAVAAERCDRPGRDVAAEGLAYVIYTSGSTGRPKGVQVSHGAVVNFLLDMRRRLHVGPGDVLLAITSLGFDIAGLELFLPLISGARVVIAGPEVSRSAAELRRALEISKATLMQATPATWRLLVEDGWVPAPDLRLLCGGEALPRDLAARLTAGGAPLWNLYGPTETTIWSASREVGPDPASVPIGRPIAATGLHVLDRSLCPLPAGVAGELYISGDGLARGYRGNPGQTAERFLPFPWSHAPGGRIYRTGDVARHLEDGALEYLGRADHQIKLRGHRIELGEIEAVLAGHPDVAQAVVHPEVASDGELRLQAYVVRRPNAADVPRPATEHMARWQGIWSSTYARPAGADPALNLAGWRSSYTGLPIPEEEMREWIDRSVAAILGLRPRRLLEIGCGTGLLLLRLAGHCEELCGTDFAAEALAHIERSLPAELQRRVRLLRREATDFTGIEPGSFDTVVLNSVVQYFPSVEHLLTVLEGALAVLASPGHVFLGDLRSLPLLEAFHASVQLHRAAPELPVSELRRRVRREVGSERELLLDPALFPALQRRWPRLSRCEVRLRRGRARNELTCFRYDVILTAGPGEEAPSAVQELDWTADELSLDELLRHLRAVLAGVVRVRRIPNARLGPALAARRLLAACEPQTTAGDLRCALQRLAPEGVDPEDLWALAETTPYTVEVGWSGDGADGCCEAVFRLPSERRPAALPAAVIEERPWSAYGTPPPSRPDAEVAADLQRFLTERLPRTMVPAGFAFLDAFPLTPNRKVDRQALRRLAAAAGAGEVRGDMPRTPAEEILASLWCELLGVGAVGTDDDFFLLGGHSLLAVQLTSRLREAFGIEVPVSAVFEAATLSRLADLVGRVQRGGPVPPPLAAGDRGGEIPLSFAQERLWLLEQGRRESGAYHIALAVELTGPLSPPRLAASLEEVVRRHEALRTGFPVLGGKPLQVVQPLLSIPVPRIDLSALPAAARPLAISRLAALAATLPFDLGRPPLLRAWLLALAEGEHVCLLTMHHIVSDGWSMNILLREMLAVYAALERGEAPGLPPLALQYPDFALWQRSWLQGEVLEREVAYWRERLAGAPPFLELPADRPRPAVLSDRGGSCVRRLSAELAGGLRAFCRSQRCTPFMALLTGFYAVLGGLTGRSDLVVGTDTASRNRLETEGLIGFFVNQLVLRLDLSGPLTLADLLARVRATVLGAFAHEDLPFNQLVAALNPPRSPGHSPVFQVKIVLQSFTPPAPEGSPLALRILPPSHVAAQLDLLLEVLPVGGELVVTAKYTRDLFEASTVERWLSHLEHVLGTLMQDPGRQLASVLEELVEADRRLQRKQEQGLESASLQRLQSARRRTAEPLRSRA